MAFEYLQGWRHLSGQLVPGLSHPHSEKAFPDVQTEPPVFRIVPTAPGHHQEDRGAILFAPSL